MMVSVKLMITTSEVKTDYYICWAHAMVLPLTYYLHTAFFLQA